jgi:(p)ppGpp synthase/HD superfamily hydrolase
MRGDTMKPENMSERLKAAIDVATVMHDGQVDKSCNPYIDHPLRVMRALEEHGEDAMIAGVLHDTVEDTDLRLSDIAHDFGPEVASIVDSVTVRDREEYIDFVLRSKEHPIGRLVKIADIRDNMLPSRMAGRTGKTTAKYERALKILLP